jgi:hypothetical protein
MLSFPISIIKTIFSNRANITFNRGDTIASLLTFFTIRGALVSFLVLPVELAPADLTNLETTVIGNFIFLKDYLCRSKRGTWPHFLVFTKTGFVNADAFIACANKAMDVWEESNPGLNALFLGDNLDVHRTLKFLESVINRGHWVHYIPAGASDWNAVPDNLPYLELKSMGQYAAEGNVWDSLVTNEKWRWNVLEAFLEAELTAFTPEIIKKAFENVGLVNAKGKFDGDLVRQRIRENLGPFRGMTNSPSLQDQSRLAATDIIDSAFSRRSKKVFIQIHNKSIDINPFLA